MCLPCAATTRACSLFVILPGGVRTTPSGGEIRTGVFTLELHGSEELFLHAWIDEEIERPRVLRMWSIEVYRRFGHGIIWQTHNDTRRRTIGIHDNRGGANGYTEEPMSDIEFELCEFAEPGFEDFSELWRRIETFLQTKGVRSVARRGGILRRMPSRHADFDQGSSSGCSSA